MKIHSNDWEMTLNNAHDPSAEYILIPIIHYEIALLRKRIFATTILFKYAWEQLHIGFATTSTCLFMIKAKRILLTVS